MNNKNVEAECVGGGGTTSMTTSESGVDWRHRSLTVWHPVTHIRLMTHLSLALLLLLVTGADDKCQLGPSEHAYLYLVA